jgi:hypothetical protein
MRRRDVGSASFAALAHAGHNVQPLTVNGNRNQAVARTQKHNSAEPVTRLLHPDGASRVQENPSRDIQRLLRTGHNHHLVRLASERPRRAQVGTHSFAESFAAERIDKAKDIDSRAS